VILACRSEPNGLEAIRKLTEEHKDRVGTVEYMKLDLQSLTSVRDFARAYLDKHIPLNYIFCNAGIAGDKNQSMELTTDGFELVWQVNYLSHYLLCDLLMDLLIQSAPSRIVNVASSMHELVDREMLNWEHASKNARDERYSISKIAQIMHAYEIQRKHSKKDRVSAVAIHPGAVNTDMWNWLKCQPLRWCLGTMYLTADEAAHVATSAALLPEDQVVEQLVYLAPNKEYCSNSHMTNDVLRIVLCCSKPGAYRMPSSPLSQDETLAVELWDASKKMLTANQLVNASSV